MSIYFTRETRKALTGVECGNYECKAFSRLFLILCPLGLDVQLSCLATFLVSPHAPTPPGQCLARAKHSLSPIPLENVESELTLTPIRELCSCSHTASPKAFRKLFAFTRLLYSLATLQRPGTPGLWLRSGCTLSFTLLFLFPDSVNDY